VEVLDEIVVELSLFVALLVDEEVELVVVEVTLALDCWEAVSLEVVVELVPLLDEVEVELVEYE
jgi:hypothetical protein